MKDKIIQFDVDNFQSDDVPFLDLMFTLPISKLHIFSNPNIKKSPQSKPIYEGSKFKEFMKLIGKNV